jgi:hypothetical protein
MWLVAQEDFIAFTDSESFKSYISINNLNITNNGDYTVKAKMKTVPIKTTKVKK